MTETVQAPQAQEQRPAEETNKFGVSSTVLYAAGRYLEEGKIDQELYRAVCRKAMTLDQALLQQQVEGSTVKAQRPKRGPAKLAEKKQAAEKKPAKAPRKAPEKKQPAEKQTPKPELEPLELGTTRTEVTMVVEATLAEDGTETYRLLMPGGDYLLSDYSTRRAAALVYPNRLAKTGSRKPRAVKGTFAIEVKPQQ